MAQHIPQYDPESLPRQLNSSTVWLLSERRNPGLAIHAFNLVDGSTHHSVVATIYLPVGQCQTDSGSVCHHFLGKSMSKGKSFVDVGSSEVLG